MPGKAHSLSIVDHRRDALGARPSRLELDADFSHARLGLRNELAMLDEAVARIEPALLEGPPQRDTLLPAVLTALGERTLPATMALPRPPPYAEPPPALSETRVAKTLQPFVRRCGLCHASNERFPPPFMAGGETAIAERLDGCAERIAYRLAMWSLPAARAPRPRCRRQRCSPTRALPSPTSSPRCAGMLQTFSPPAPPRSLPNACSPATTPAFPPAAPRRLPQERFDE